MKLPIKVRMFKRKRGRKKKLTPEIEQVVVALAKQHKTQREIAEAVSVSKTTISNFLQAKHPELVGRRGGKRRMFTDKEKEKMRKMYIEEGLTSVQVGKKLKCSSNVVLRTLTSMKVPIRPLGRPPSPLLKKTDQIVKDLQKFSFKEAAEKYGVSEATLRRYFKRKREYETKWKTGDIS